MPAANIDECIQDASTDIAKLSYDGVHSLYVQFQLWITGMFSDTGIFLPTNNNTRPDMGQRVVTDWYGAHILAQEQIEGQGVGQSGVVGTSAVINAVARVLTAVKFGKIDGFITTAQENAVVTLYNAVWEP